MTQIHSEERVEYLRPAALPGIELLCGYNSTRRWRVFHETYTFCGCETASARWRYRNKELPLSDRTNMLMEPGETHCNTAVHKSANFKVVLINPEIFINSAKELGLAVTPHLRFGYSEDSRLFSTLYRFCQAVETGADILEQQSWFATCIGVFLEHAERKPPTMVVSNGHRAVERVKRYLRERFSESITLRELAAISGFSRFHLVHTFTKLVCERRRL